ncbi:MAG: class I SAM-dependent methyltransferase [archaeon]
MTESEKNFFEKCIYTEKGFVSYEEFFASDEGKNHIKKRMHTILRFKKKGNFLDIGCAFGYYLKEASKNFNVFGVDVSGYAIKKARKTVNCPETNLIKCSAEKLPFKDNFFDVIIAVHSIEHIKDYRKVLKECSRVLKKDGILFLDFPTKLFEFPHFIPVTKKEVFELNSFLKKIGLGNKIQFIFDKTHVSSPFPWNVASGKYLKPFFEAIEIKPEKKWKQLISSGFQIIAKPVK